MLNYINIQNWLQLIIKNTTTSHSNVRYISIQNATLDITPLFHCLFHDRLHKVVKCIHLLSSLSRSHNHLQSHIRHYTLNFFWYPLNALVSPSSTNCLQFIIKASFWQAMLYLSSVTHSTLIQMCNTEIIQYYKTNIDFFVDGECSDIICEFSNDSKLHFLSSLIIFLSCFRKKNSFPKVERPKRLQCEFFKFDRK